MPITVACKCGKQFRARDEDAGKRARCPGCGQPITIPGGEGAARPSGPRAELSKPRQAVGTSIGDLLTPKVITLIAVGVLIASGAVTVKMAVSARNDWAKASKDGEAYIADGIVQAMKADIQQRGGIVMSVGPARPQVQEVNFVDINVMLTMPEKVGFFAKTGVNLRGVVSIKGRYFPRKRSFEADLPSAGGKARLVEGSWDQDGKLTVLLDGQPAKYDAKPATSE